MKGSILKHTAFKNNGIFFVLLLFFGFFAQAQELKSSIDRDSIRIGEQLNYTMEVEASPSDKIVFPQGQSFLPLEVIDSTAIDTFLVKDKMRLVRTYPLTQFDAGRYTIPAQTLIVNGEGVYTDTFSVKVLDVVVDTTQQKLFPIKPALDIKPSFSFPTWIWWVLGAVLLALLVFWILWTRKKIIEKKKDLPPYEKAIQSLRQLDENQDLEAGRIKSYYTVLSDALKRYVDEKMDHRALESTTDEFILLLKAYKKEKNIYLKEQVIDGLEAILKRADLAKFAGIQTDRLTAKEDRQTVEENISAFDKAIPEPTEEEKMLDATYREKVERKQRQKKMMIRWAMGVVAIAVVLSVFVGLKGVGFVQSLMGGQTNEKLLKTEWVTSEYGKLGVTLTTPDVLVREMDSVVPTFPRQTDVEERFKLGSIDKDLMIKVVNIRFKEGAQLDSIDVGNMLDKAMGDAEMSLMTFKAESFKTGQNMEGQRVFGTFTLESASSEVRRKKAYTFLALNERGGLQEVLVVYNLNDEAGKAIENRVINSVEFNTEHDG